MNVNVNCMDPATAHRVSYGTMCNILHVELGLVKKLEGWVPKLLSEDQKKKRVRNCTEYVAAVNPCSGSMLDNIVSAVSYHTP